MPATVSETELVIPLPDYVSCHVCFFCKYCNPCTISLSMLISKQWLITDRSKAQWLRYKRMVADAQESNVELPSEASTSEVLQVRSGILFI